MLIFRASFKNTRIFYFFKKKYCVFKNIWKILCYFTKILSHFTKILGYSEYPPRLLRETQSDIQVNIVFLQDNLNIFVRYSSIFVKFLKQSIFQIFWLKVILDLIFPNIYWALYKNTILLSFYLISYQFLKLLTKTLNNLFIMVYKLLTTT